MDNRSLKNSLLLSVLFLLIAVPHAFDQVQYPLLFDNTYSARMGAHSIITLHLTAQVGYKTAGFLEGEQLAGSIVLRTGISFLGL